jgi:hypothetical protein
MSKNDITGDSIRSKPLSKEAEDNWDRIFSKLEKTIEEHKDIFEMLKESEQQDKTQDPITKPFPHKILRQSRIDTIGQNGNDGDHYEYELNKSTGDVEKRFKDGVSKPNGEQFDE